VFSVYALQTTAVPPMVLSAAAELQEHLDSSFCKVVSTPVWTNIRPDDPRNKISPLYPKSVGYDQPPPPSPAAGPSTKAKGKQRAVPEEDSEDEHGRQRGRAKRPRAMSIVAAPKSKRQRAKSKSKAIITSDDDMELDNAVPAAAPQRAPAPAKVSVLSVVLSLSDRQHSPSKAFSRARPYLSPTQSPGRDHTMWR
jgi:hypothetical protein